MATIGCKYPVCAKLLAEDAETGNTYGTGAFIGRERTLTVTPNIASQLLSGDDMADAEEVKEFVSAAVALETTFIPRDVAVILFGSTYAAATQSAPAEMKDSANDTPNNVGFGCIVKVIENGVKSWMLYWINKVMYDLPAETITTKGDNVTFGTPTINGTAKATLDGFWRIKQFYNTEAEAFAALKAMANIADSAAEEDADPEGTE